MERWSEQDVIDDPRNATRVINTALDETVRLRKRLKHGEEDGREKEREVCLEIIDRERRLWTGSGEHDLLACLDRIVMEVEKRRKEYKNCQSSTE